MPMIFLSLLDFKNIEELAEIYDNGKLCLSPFNQKMYRVISF